MNRTKAASVAFLTLMLIGGAIWYLRKARFPPDEPTPPVKISVGWQRQWATQGQVMKALDKTNIAALYGADLILRDFQYGPDLNEAAVTGALQVTNAGIVPIINLLAKSDDWIIVARHIDFLVSIVARKDSGVNSIPELKGKRFGVPIGGGTHPYALSRLQDNGLAVGEGINEVNVINVQPIDQPATMKQKIVDAVAVWEPTISVLLKYGGYIIDKDSYCGFVAVRKSFAAAHHHEIVQMLKAYIEAFLYAAQHKQQTDQWFSEASGIDYDLVANIQAIEPTLKAKGISDISLTVDPARLAKTQQVADVMYRLKLIQRPVQVQDRVDFTLYDQAARELQASGGKTGWIHPK